MKNSSQSVPMTEGSIARAAHRLCDPTVSGESVSAALQYGGFADRRKFSGKRGAGGRQFLRSLIFLMVGFFNGISIGAGVVIARYYGARQIDRVQKAIHTTVAFGLVAGVLLTVIGLVLAPLLLVWMGTPGKCAAKFHRLFPDLFLRLHRVRSV